MLLELLRAETISPVISESSCDVNTMVLFSFIETSEYSNLEAQKTIAPTTSDRAIVPY